jgi:fructan beta-fructosidase
MILLISLSTRISPQEQPSTMQNNTAQYRPRFHFSPPAGWMNDPNGMVYYDGEYHLFYQHTPDEINLPKPKHWGHAVSKDLVLWEHLPIALYPDHLGEIWSGSAVVDWHNTSGLQTGDEPVLVAIFTHFDDGIQQQSLASSNDRGRTWAKFNHNPVIANPGLKDFRDPKVFWHPGTGNWVMVLAAGDRVMLYISPNLINWAQTSEFGALEGAHGGVWECPDLFPLNLDGEPDQEYWVLIVSVGSGAPNGGSGTQYFIGQFDGETFTNLLPATAVRWLDFGTDNYAGVTYSDIPKRDGRRILIGWMNNWRYAYQVPTSPWRGTMTLPRELKLITGHNGSPYLITLPIQELEKLRRDHNRLPSPTAGEAAPFEIDGQAFEVIVEFDPGNAAEVGLLFSNSGGDRVQVGYDNRAEVLFIDRRSSGLVDFNPDFSRHNHSAPLRLDSGRLHLQIFVDACSIEVFGNDGIVAITDQIFPRSKLNQVAPYALDGEARLIKSDIWQLDPHQ